MSEEIFQDPRVRQLLVEADSLRGLLSSTQDKQGKANISRVLAGIYHDLGLAIHELLPAPKDFEDTHDTDVMNLSELNERIRVADETEDPRVIMSAPWDPDDEITSVRTMPRLPELEDPADTMGYEHVRAIAESGDMEAVGALPPWQAAPTKAPTDAKPKLPWVDALGDTLELVALPDDLDLGGELSAEASRIQWCTLDLEERWSQFPKPIQLALLGLLAARARHLQRRLDSPIGPKLALERLTVFQEKSDLAKVVGLHPNRSPELSSWEEDAHQWWETLLKGLENV